MAILINDTEYDVLVAGVLQDVLIAGVEYSSEDTPAGFSLASWALPSGKQVASGPALIRAAAGVGDGGYTLGLWARPHSFHNPDGFGTLVDGSLDMRFAGVDFDVDEIKYDLDGSPTSSSAYRLAVSKWYEVGESDSGVDLDGWLDTLTNGQFILQTPNRTMTLSTSRSTDRSQGGGWVSWYIHGSQRAGATIWLTADDITELNRLRTEGDLFIAAFVEDA